jgi:hypothetical protein
MKPDPCVNSPLLGLRQGVPPGLEVIGELHLPRHNRNYSIDSILPKINTLTKGLARGEGPPRHPAFILKGRPVSNQPLAAGQAAVQGFADLEVAAAVRGTSVGGEL